MREDRVPPDNVLDFRQELVRQKQVRRRHTALLVAEGLLVGALGGLAGIYWPFGQAKAETRPKHSFAVCGMVRRTCVVDGDTIWLEGVKIRIADIDHRRFPNRAAIPSTISASGLATAWSCC